MTIATAEPDADLRAGEVSIPLPDAFDAGLYFIGRARTPWTTKRACPRQGDRLEGPLCRLDIDARWRAGLRDIGRHTHLLVLTFLDRSRRDLVEQSPRSDGATTGTFSLRSPIRPNPIGASLVELVETHADHLIVRGLDCLDGTPLLDVKPEKCPEAPRPKLPD